MTQEIVEYTEYSPPKSPGIEKPPSSDSTHLEPIKYSPVVTKNDEDSNILCPATPPKFNRKHIE